MKAKMRDYPDLDSINAELSTLAVRTYGLACILRFARLDDSQTLEDAETALKGIGEVPRQEWKRLRCSAAQHQLMRSTP